MGYTCDLVATLELVRTQLAAELGEGRAHYDPAKVNPPGVWINFLGLDALTLDGTAVRLELVLAVPSGDPKTVAGKLTPLWNTVVELFGRPDGPTRTQATIFPDSPNPRPSLVLPYLARS